MSTLRALLAAAGLVLLAGCSATQFMYDNAGTLIRWRATSYLDVHGEPSRQLDARIAGFLAWHRASALPQYAVLAEAAALRFARGLAREDLDWAWMRGREQLGESLRSAARAIAPLLDQLDAAQIAHLESRLAEDNRKFSEENLEGSEAKRRSERAKRMVKRLQEWFGTLNDAQRERVQAYSARAPLTDALRDADRRRRQTALLELIRKRAAGNGLADWAEGWDRGRAPAYEAASRAQRAALFDLLL
ncbi:MAG: DUF6279 family lipoprotein, partial [Proteobacteria bacterium]|nr:DUF6279 family lipoprotein [Pseudomonadota bacterium]